MHQIPHSTPLNLGGPYKFQHLNRPPAVAPQDPSCANVPRRCVRTRIARPGRGMSVGRSDPMHTPCHSLNTATLMRTLSLRGCPHRRPRRSHTLRTPLVARLAQAKRLRRRGLRAPVRHLMRRHRQVATVLERMCHLLLQVLVRHRRTSCMEPRRAMRRSIRLVGSTRRRLRMTLTLHMHRRRRGFDRWCGTDSC